MKDTLDLSSGSESDALLMQRIADRDTVALEVLYDHHAQTIFNVLIRIVKNPSVAEDLVQETFWQAWCKAEQYKNKGIGTVAGWLFCLARNKAIDHLRQQKAYGWQETLDWKNRQEEQTNQHANVSSRNTTEAVLTSYLSSGGRAFPPNCTAIIKKEQPYE